MEANELIQQTIEKLIEERDALNDKIRRLKETLKDEEPEVKGGMSKAARKKIAEATRQRWALKRAQKAEVEAMRDLADERITDPLEEEPVPTE